MLNSDLDRNVTICTQKTPSSFDYLSRLKIMHQSRFFYHCKVNRLPYIMQEKSQVMHDSFDSKMMRQTQAVRMAKFMNTFQVQEESPFLVNAKELPGGSGGLIFDGNQFSLRKRRYWILENAGTIKFTLDKNNLKPDSRLTISGFDSTLDIDEFYIE